MPLDPAAHLGMVGLAPVAVSLCLSLYGLFRYLRHGAKKAGAHAAAGRICVPTLLWWAAFAAILVCSGLLVANELLQIRLRYFALFCIGVSVASLIALARDARCFTDSDGRFHGIFILVLDVALLASIVYLGWYALETPFNPDLPTVGSAVLAERIVIALLVVALFFVGQETGVLVAPLLVALLIAGSLEYYVEKFRWTGIYPSDIFTINTAWAVGDQYDYSVSYFQVKAAAAAVAGLLACCYVRPIIGGEKVGKPVFRALGNLVVGALVLAALAFGLLERPWETDFNVSVSNWAPEDSYKQNGLLISFIRSLKDMRVVLPEGFDELEATALEAKYAESYQDERYLKAQAQFAEQKPNIIFLLSESFTDLSMFDGLGVGYEGPQYFKNSLTKESLLQGGLLCTVYGGGTHNTEFDVLTGVSLALVADGKSPFTMFTLTDINSIPRNLSQIGYRTVAIHPHQPTNYRRDIAYPELGIDEFISYSDFDADVERLHGFVADTPVYDKIMEVLETSDDPAFVHILTMQNHSDYNRGGIPEEKQLHVAPDSFDEELQGQVDEYVSLIESTDQDLAPFIERLRNLDEPTLLVFYGDHHPRFTKKINDLLMTGEDEFAHENRCYVTSYCIWANYDVAGIDAADLGTEQLLSTNYLGLEALSLVGAPLNQFEASQMALREQVQAVNFREYLGADGVEYPVEGDTPYRSAIDDLATIGHLEFTAKLR